jgi:hypothetical protein
MREIYALVRADSNCSDAISRRGQIDEDCRATTVAHSPSRAPIAAVLRFKKQGRSHAHNNTATFRKSSSQSTKMP